jgi:hypothetical protein
MLTAMRPGCEPRTLPAAQVGRRLAQDPVTERHDEAAGFHQGQEDTGHDQARLRIAPAHQRLEAADLPRTHVDLGLVVELELLALDGAAQAMFHGHARHHGRRPLEPMRQVFLAAALGAAQRLLGVLDQRVGVIAIVGVTRETAFHVHRDATAFHVEWRAKHLDDLGLHPVHGLVLVAVGLHDHGEGAGAEVRQPLGGIRMALEPIGNLLEQQVAGVTAERIVDGREVFDVEHGHRRRTAAADARFQRADQAIAEQAALGEAGERVVIRQETDLVFLVEVLQRKRQVGHELAQHALLFVADRAGIIGSEQQRADGRAVHQQREGDDAAEPWSMRVARAASGIAMVWTSLQTSAVPVRSTRPVTLVSSAAESAIVKVSLVASCWSNAPDQAAGRAVRVPGSINATMALA